MISGFGINFHSRGDFPCRLCGLRAARKLVWFIALNAHLGTFGPNNKHTRTGTHRAFTAIRWPALNTNRNCCRFFNNYLHSHWFFLRKSCRKVSATRCQCVEFCMLKFMLPDTPLCVTSRRESAFGRRECGKGARASARALARETDLAYQHTRREWGWVFLRSFGTGVRRRRAVQRTGRASSAKGQAFSRGWQVANWIKS